VNRKRYKLLGWIVWRVGERAAKKKAAQNRGKLGAVAIIAVVLVAGIAASKSASDS
jgi:hypothetical protein